MRFLIILSLSFSCFPLYGEGSVAEKDKKPAVEAVDKKENPGQVKPSGVIKEEEPAEGNKDDEKASPEEEYKIPDGKTIPKAEKIDETHIRIGQVTIDTKERSFSIPVEVHMSEGLIEYLVSMPHGKLHETLFTTMADPFHMSVACKLLNFPSFKGMFPERDENLEWKPYKEPKREDFINSLIDITASWEKDGKKISMPASDLLKYKNTDQPLSAHEWALIDSTLYKKTYQASVIGDVVAVYGDGNALIAYTGFANDGENVWLADTKKLPAQGTAVTLTFKKLSKKEADKPVARRPRDISVPSAEHYLD